MIPIAKPLLGAEEGAAAAEAIASGWVTQGPQVAAFEESFAAYVGAGHAVAVSSCTAALHLALLAAGVEPGDEVITVSHSFIASANAVRYCGAQPVFVDVDRSSFNIEPTAVAAAITPQTRAVLAVHQMGMPCDLVALSDLCQAHDLVLIEDAACAIGSEVRIDASWRKIGAPVGAVACFSFHPRKLITTGDGGMLTTDDAELAQRFRLLRQHGMSVSDVARHGSNQVIFEEYPVLGFNYRMTDIQAAVGRVQMTRLDDIVQERRRLVQLYRTRLTQWLQTGVPSEPEWARSNWQSFCVALPEGRDQKTVMQRMLDAGVATRRGVMCAHREGAYAGKALPHSLANSEWAQDHAVILPLFPGMTEDEIDTVVAALRAACDLN